MKTAAFCFSPFQTMLAVQRSFRYDVRTKRLGGPFNLVELGLFWFLSFLKKKDSQYRFPGLVGAVSVSVEMSGEQPSASPRRLFVKPSLSSKGSHSPDGSPLRKVRQLQKKREEEEEEKQTNQKQKKKRNKRKQKKKKKLFSSL
jgi:hypothetical protein